MFVGLGLTSSLFWSGLPHAQREVEHVGQCDEPPGLNSRTVSVSRPRCDC